MGCSKDTEHINDEKPFICGTSYLPPTCPVKTCSYCGANMADNAKFCESCGKFKVCSYCAANITSEANFCGSCGTKVTPTIPSKIDTKEKDVSDIKETSIPPRNFIVNFFIEPKNTKKIFIAGLALVCILVIGISLIFINPTGMFDGVRSVIVADPAADVIIALEEEDYVLALMLAHEVEHEPLQRRLENRLETLEADFRAENRDFILIMSEIDIIRAMNVDGLSNTLQNTSRRIENLNSSRTAFATAEAMFQNSDYPSAIAQYRLVIQDDANYEQALRGLQNSISAYRTKVLELADENIERGDYAGAIFALNNGLWTLENDSALTEALNLNKQSLVNNAIASARSSIDIGNYDIATFALNVALQAVPSNEQLTRMLDEINLIRPMNLLTLEPVRSWDWNPNETRTQIPLIHERGWGTNFISEAEFFVDAGYSFLRGIISADESLNPNSRMQLFVFTDDVLIYESDFIQRASAFDFEISIAGARFIRLRVNNQPPEGSWNITSGRFSASDLFLIR